jgi:putative NADPH-quinone reductase
MRVLTVYAHHNPQSFCHAIMERFCAGLKDAGHANELVDLHAIGFDPVFSERDEPNWIDDSVPDDVLGHIRIRERMLESTRNPVSRWLVRRWIGGSNARDVIRRVRARRGPADIAEQQEKVRRAEALAFIAPVYFVGFPAILKGWIERVFTLGWPLSSSPRLARRHPRPRPAAFAQEGSHHQHYHLRPGSVRCGLEGRDEDPRRRFRPALSRYREGRACVFPCRAWRGRRDPQELSRAIVRSGQELRIVRKKLPRELKGLELPGASSGNIPFPR